MSNSRVIRFLFVVCRLNFLLSLQFLIYGTATFACFFYTDINLILNLVNLYCEVLPLSLKSV